MKVGSECLPCLARQVLTTARIIRPDEEGRRELVAEGMRVIAEADLDKSPGEICFDCLTRIYDMSGCEDPYIEIKDKQNRLALDCLEKLEKDAEEADDPLYFALKLAAAGNIIDSGVRKPYDLDATVKRVVERPFGCDDYPRLRAMLAGAERILYIVDNAGEIVFDRLVVERLGEAEVTCVVRRRAVLNDATRRDAAVVGLDKVARIIDVGIDAVGVPLHRCSDEFRAECERADIVISKGQANFETLDEYIADEALVGKLFFLLMSKCDCVSEILGVQTGDAVLKFAG